ncbi:hypothetical protein DPMN_101887 [Dreissena polymorpha]|uniref:Uncharacterized protein n=1 Tax=Dreissena polymorpha TaxID=45954 RepID=A0A9D4R8P4_DREPO|nr:hypothetical protein DPMN_101887 [Dreissena polymorpha]
MVVFEGCVNQLVRDKTIFIGEVEPDDCGVILTSLCFSYQLGDRTGVVYTAKETRNASFLNRCVDLVVG